MGGSEDLPDNLRLFEIEVPDGLPVEVLPLRMLPRNWQQAGDLQCRTMGDDWLNGRRTLLLEVPSAIIPEEPNYLVNPTHPDITTVRVVQAREFLFDERLLGQRVWTGKVLAPAPLRP